MDFSVLFENIDWAGVFAAFAVAVGWGFAWYSPVGLGSIWDKASKTKIEKNIFQGQTLVIILLLAFIKAFTLGLFMVAVDGVVDGASTGAVIGLGFVVPSLAILYTLAKRSQKVLVMDAASIVIGYSLMGAAFGLLN